MYRPAAQAGFFSFVRRNCTLKRFVKRQVMCVSRRPQGAMDASPPVTCKVCG